MSAPKLQCDVVSAEQSVFSGEIEMLIASGSMGDLGVSHGHAPLITNLQPGPVRIVVAKDDERTLYVSGGLLEVQPNGVTLLADTAVRAEDVDEAAAIEAKQQAELAIKKRGAEFEYTKAATQLAEAAAQLRTISQIKKQLGRQR